jgi:hypothetical protein
MARLQRIDHSAYPLLDEHDECLYVGEYTSGGGFQASDTNQSIMNLKKKPGVSANQLVHKDKAIYDWGNRLAKLLALSKVATTATLVPAPCSKPIGHVGYDDRMLRVLRQMATHETGLDVRSLLMTSAARPAQHESGRRLTVEELQQSMTVDQSLLTKPLHGLILVVDDVFTKGATFKAMKGLLLGLPNVKRVAGIFLAKTVWPQPDFSHIDLSDF